MNTRLLTTFGASALIVGGAAIGLASASARDAADAKAAAAGAARASKALARHDPGVAIAEAERAVGLSPRDPGYRLLLGQSYLAAGRFQSARGAFADTLSLAPTDGKAALNLVLAQIATGDWGAARRTLDEHGAGIAPADKGLALALAGDPAGAVQLLTQVARSPDTSPKVRQNLALSLALSGEWPAARAVAAVDMSPADVDARLAQWAAFAHPRAASDQVATLLGVTAVADAGQPIRLALGGEPAVTVAAVAAPVSPLAPAPTGEAKPVPAETAVVDAATQPGFVAATVVFGPRAEVVQPLATGVAASRLYTRSGPTKVVLDAQGKATPLAKPAPTTVVAVRAPRPLPASTPAPAKVAAASAPAPAPRPAAAAPATHGKWFVQLGAFASPSVARAAWTQAAHRLPALAARGPSGAGYTARKVSFYRLSVGGFARPQADALCQRYRASGGSCFVRPGAGDQVAGWAKKGEQLAAK